MGNTTSLAHYAIAPPILASNSCCRDPSFPQRLRDRIAALTGTARKTSGLMTWRFSGENPRCQKPGFPISTHWINVYFTYI